MGPIACCASRIASNGKSSLRWPEAIVNRKSKIVNRWVLSKKPFSFELFTFYLVQNLHSEFRSPALHKFIQKSKKITISSSTFSLWQTPLLIEGQNMCKISRRARYNTIGFLGVCVTIGKPWRKHYEPYAFDRTAQRISGWPKLGSVLENVPANLNSPATINSPCN